MDLARVTDLNHRDAEAAEKGIIFHTTVHGNLMDIRGFDLEQPEDVCDHNGLDENVARAHFNGKQRNEIIYSDIFLIEDLMWMHHNAFKYYLPGFLLTSLQDDYGELASATLGVIGSHISGPKEKRIRFTEDETLTIDKWMDLILAKFNDNDSWAFKKQIAKYKPRIG